METKWYSAITNKGSAHEQGLIIEEGTGNSIAVSYKAENAKLLAAAPELLEIVRKLADTEANEFTSEMDHWLFIAKLRKDAQTAVYDLPF